MWVAVVMNSPLGKYAQAVAAVTAVGIIAAWIIAVFLRAFGIEVESTGLKEVALIALGAVFGSAATINGVKAPLDSAHSRIDKIETATGIQTHGSYLTEAPGGTFSDRHDEAHDAHGTES